MTEPGDLVVVWGNCQAAPLATLLTPALHRAGLTVVAVPPVFEVDAAGLARVHDLLRRTAVLVTHPIKDEYRIPGCGSEQLAARLPASATVVRVASAHDVGPFPLLVNGYDGDGERVDAPLTTYQDLRNLTTVELDVPGVHRVAATATAELERRELGVDVAVSPYLRVPEAMFTFNHPSNRVLAAVARAVLERLGLPAEVTVPEREFLGAVRAPVEPAVATAFGWPGAPSGWVVGGRSISTSEVAQAHLRWYASRPDVVAATVARHAGRIAALTG